MREVAGIVFDCVGCAEPTIVAGPDQVLLGLLVAALAMAPLGVLHLALRRRGR